MRIAFISPFLYRYQRGIERYTIDLANTFAKAGHEVHLVTWKSGMDWNWGELQRGVSLHVLNLPKYFSAFFAGISYAFLLPKLKLDIILLAFSWHGEETGFNFKAFKNSKTYLVLHYPLSQFPYRYQTLRVSSLRQTSSLIGVSRFVSREAEHYFDQQVTVIPNGVDLDRFRLVDSEEKKEKRKELGIPIDTPLILTIAALEERKGIVKVLNALPVLLKKYPYLNYIVVGEGSEKERLKKEAEKLKISEHVIFIKATNKPETFYQAADLLIFLAKGEAFGLVVAEAMACGLPVIAANRPPLDEFSGSGGVFYVNDEDSREVANSIEQLVQNPERRDFMGKANRAFVDPDYSWDNIAENYLQCFKKAKCLNG